MKIGFTKKTIGLLLCVCSVNMLFAQVDTLHKKIYHVRVKYELPASLACIGLSTAGFRNLDKVSIMTESQVLKLNPANINGFDRPIASINPKGFLNAQKNSDLFLNVCLFSPIVLALDKHIRKDWLDLISLYLVSHAADNALYFIGTYSVRRARPLAYNTLLPISERIGEGKSNSFFSGHTSFSATATFFTAKVFTDYHHIKGWRRLLIYSAAAVPPSLVGYFRMRAGKHFKTDVMMGLIAGASSGILIPELHKWKKKHENISFYPYYSPGAAGLTTTIGF